MTNEVHVTNNQFFNVHSRMDKHQNTTCIMTPCYKITVSKEKVGIKMQYSAY